MMKWKKLELTFKKMLALSEIINNLLNSNFKKFIKLFKTIYLNK